MEAEHDMCMCVFGVEWGRNFLSKVNKAILNPNPVVDMTNN